MILTEEAKNSDLEAILSLQKLVYESEAKLYNDWSLPALILTIESLQEFIITFTNLSVDCDTVQSLFVKDSLNSFYEI